jgi:ethanolamine utilization protein EutQ (cupin superfamily)
MLCPLYSNDCESNCSDDADKTISSGFFRLEKGTPLVYSYWYDEMKIILEGEFHISDECGNSVIGKPGDVFKFPKGCKITFDTPTMGLAFFVGQRETGKL